MHSWLGHPREEAARRQEIGDGPYESTAPGHGAIVTSNVTFAGWSVIAEIHTLTLSTTFREKS
jgi:hypothetical protein